MVPSEDVDAEEVPETERFEIRRKLGEGGMGVVYEAYDRERPTIVALKTLRHAHATALARFKGEFRALQRLEHPNLVSLGELITAGRLSFFTMELVAGVPFLEYVRAGDVCDEARLRACLAQLAPALAALHANSIVHRDVKPSNVLVTGEGRVVLLDLGLALDTRPAVTTSADADVVGTVAYMAPEQAQSGKVGPAADWYALGVVLYEALTGTLPHGGGSALEVLMNKLQTAPPPPRARARRAALVGAAAGCEPADLVRHLARLRIASLVRTSGLAGPDRVAPYHGRIAGAVLAGLDEASRRAGHEALAAALASSPVGRDAPELLLRHLAAAGDAAGAARHAELAADRAATGLAFERAAELYREALRLGAPTGEPRRSLELRLADALANAGRGPEAAEIYMRAADGADPATRLECRRRAAEQLIITGHLDAGLGALEQLLAEEGVTARATPARVIASLLWQRMRLRMRGLDVHTRHASEIAEADLRRIDVLRAAGLGLGFIDPIRGAELNLRYLRAALAAGEPSRIVPALGAEAIYQSTRGGRGLARSRELLDRVRALAETHDSPLFRAWSSGVDGIWNYFSNRFVEAATLMERATAEFREANAPTWERNNIQMLHLLALRYIGDLAGFRALFETCVRDADRRGDRFLESTARRNSNIVWLAADDPAAADDNLAQATWTPPQGRLHLQHWYELESRGELALYVGDRTAAARFATPLSDFFSSLLPRVSTVRIAARWLEVRLHLAAGDAPAARRSASLLAREELPMARVWSALAAAALATDADRATHLRAAIAAAAAPTGMSLHAAAARHRLGTLLGGTEGATEVAAADAAMRAQGIIAPARLVDVLAPALSTS